MTDEQIKHMVNRFLGWRLPADFSPDCGISAVRPNYAPEVEWAPSGTNLLNAQQATEMVRYMLNGLERAAPSPRHNALAQAIRKEIERLRDEILADMPPPTSEVNQGIRVGMGIAARIVERGRRLTATEKMENLRKAIFEDEKATSND